MLVPMMGVGIMRVGMTYRIVAMPMCMTGFLWHKIVMFVLVMFVMYVLMSVLQCIMGVRVIVTLG